MVKHELHSGRSILIVSPSAWRRDQYLGYVPRVKIWVRARIRVRVEVRVIGL